MFDIQVIKLVIDNTALEKYESYYFDKHPKATKKPIAHPYHESINEWMIMKRPMMNALKQKWKDFIVYFIHSSEYKDVHIEQCEIRFTTFYGTERRHDIDNGCPKFILDGLCESGFIIDDDSKHITSLTMQCFVDTENPRTEIEVSVSKLLTNYKPKELKEAAKMAKKVKKVSVSALDTILKNTYDPVEVVEWNGVEFTIQKSLEMDDMLNFVDSVVRSCFSAATNEYRPEAKDFAVRVNIMTRYANIAMPNKVEHQYSLAVCSGVVEMIMEHINRAQFNEMMRAIDAKVNNLAAANVEMMNMKFDELVSSFDDMQKRLTQTFADITSDDIKKIAEGLSVNGMPSDKGIVDAYLDHKNKESK